MKKLKMILICRLELNMLNESQKQIEAIDIPHCELSKFLFYSRIFKSICVGETTTLITRISTTMTPSTSTFGSNESTEISGFSLSVLKFYRASITFTCIKTIFCC